MRGDDGTWMDAPVQTETAFKRGARGLEASPASDLGPLPAPTAEPVPAPAQDPAPVEDGGSLADRGARAGRRAGYVGAGPVRASAAGS